MKRKIFGFRGNPGSEIFFLFLFFTIYLWKVLPGAETNWLWQDESGVVWIWNHPLFSRDYFAAIRSHIMAPPADFVAGGIFWKTIRFIFPSLSLDSLEAFCRIYPITVSLGSITVLVFLAKEILGRFGPALVISAALILASAQFNYYSVEVRFYAALIFFSGLSLYFFAKDRLWALLVVSSLAGWFHVYSLIPALSYSLILFWKRKQDWKKYVFPIVGVFFSLLLLAFYISRFANGAKGAPLEIVFPVSEHLSLWWMAIQTFFPAHWMWVFMGCSLFILVSLVKESRYRKFAVAFLLQFFLSLIVVQMHARSGYTWGGRYLLFIYWPMWLIALISVRLVTEKLNLVPWDRALSIVAALLFAILPKAGGKEFVPGGDGYVQVRKLIRGNGYSVVGVAGVNFSSDRSLATFERGGMVGLSWELYSGGLDRLPSIRDYYQEEKKSGGLLGYRCNQVNGLKSAAPALGTEVIVSFCNEKPEAILTE